MPKHFPNPYAHRACSDKTHPYVPTAPTRIRYPPAVIGFSHVLFPITIAPTNCPARTPIKALSYAYAYLNIEGNLGLR